jgi:proline iminopeptidase
MRESVGLDDGTSLSVTVTGEGAPLVLCHGGPGLWDYLGPLASLLEDSVRVIRYDQRGCGRSSGLDGPFTIEQFVEDLDQLRQALDVDRWWVGGHSWGAQLALYYGLAHPEGTRGVLYIAGTGIGDGYRMPYRAERERRLGADRGRWQELSERNRTADEEHEWCVLQWATDYSPTVNGRAFAEADWATRDTGVTVNHACNRQLSEANVAMADQALAQLPALAPPLLVLHGSDDPRPVAATDSLVAASRDARQTVIVGAGHSPWVEKPSDTRQLILGFLDADPKPAD